MSPWREPIRSPDISELETLVACMTEGSLAAAGAALGISRPAVAKRIKNLEALAGRTLLDRGRGGVDLTDAGAALLAGAIRMLGERDALIDLLTELRADGPSSISGLRKLLGHNGTGVTVAQRPETRLAETERVLELVLSTSATAVALADLDTGVIHEANPAFCAFVGREREEFLGKRIAALEDWFDSPERRRMVTKVEADGVVRNVVVNVPQPDGSYRRGETTVFLIKLAGARLLLGITEDLSEPRTNSARRTGSSQAPEELVRLPD